MPTFEELDAEHVRLSQALVPAEQAEKEARFEAYLTPNSTTLNMVRVAAAHSERIKKRLRAVINEKLL